jgi:hypothetical protein
MRLFKGIDVVLVHEITLTRAHKDRDFLVLAFKGEGRAKLTFVVVYPLPARAEHFSVDRPKSANHLSSRSTTKYGPDPC